MVKKCHYLTVKSLFRLLQGITANQCYNDFYYINCLQSFKLEPKLKSQEYICKNHDYCYIEMPIKDKNILKYDHGEKYTKVLFVILFVIYTDTESSHEKLDTINNEKPEKPLTMKIGKHTVCGYSLFTHCSFHGNKNKLDYYRGKDCMKILIMKKGNATTNKGNEQNTPYTSLLNMQERI